MTPPDIAAILNRAADYVAAGWTHSEYWNAERGDRDIVAAIQDAAADALPDSPIDGTIAGRVMRAVTAAGHATIATIAVAEYLELPGDPNDAVIAIMEWNDTEGRTADEVETALRTAAERHGGA